MVGICVLACKFPRVARLKPCRLLLLGKRKGKRDAGRGTLARALLLVPRGAYLHSIRYLRRGFISNPKPGLKCLLMLLVLVCRTLFCFVHCTVVRLSSGGPLPDQASSVPGSASGSSLPETKSASSLVGLLLITLLDRMKHINCEGCCNLLYSLHYLYHCSAILRWKPPCPGPYSRAPGSRRQRVTHPWLDPYYIARNTFSMSNTRNWCRFDAYCSVSCTVPLFGHPSVEPSLSRPLELPDPGGSIPATKVAISLAGLFLTTLLDHRTDGSQFGRPDTDNSERKETHENYHALRLTHDSLARDWGLQCFGQESLNLGHIAASLAYALCRSTVACLHV